MSGLVLYRGPSQIDGQDIVAIATGLEGDSRNEKTGGVAGGGWRVAAGDRRRGRARGASPTVRQ